MARRVLRALLILAAAGCAASPASSHPHVWVRSRAAVVYDGGGRITAIRHDWTFDEAYSAFAVQGFEKESDGRLKASQLADLAKTNIDSLAENGYFTLAKANGAKLAFDTPTTYRTSYDKGALTLSFELPLKTPAKADRAFLFEVYDPSFFVDFSIEDGADAVRLEGAPKGCALNVTRPKPPDPAQQQTVSESFFSALSAASNYGAQFTSRVLVACP